MSCETIKTLEPIKNGTTFPSFTIKIPDTDNPGNYLDLTGYNICMQMRKRSGGRIEHQFDMTIGSPDVYTATSPSWTVNMDEFNYFADIKITNASGVIGQTDMFIIPIENIISEGCQ